MSTEFANAIERLAIRGTETPDEAAEELERQEANERRRAIAAALHERALWGGERISAEMAALPPKERAEYLHKLRRRCLEDGPGGHDADAVATHAALLLLLDRTILDAEQSRHGSRKGEALRAARRAIIPLMRDITAEARARVIAETGRSPTKMTLRGALLQHVQIEALFPNRRVEGRPEQQDADLSRWARTEPLAADLGI